MEENWRKGALSTHRYCNAQEACVTKTSPSPGVNGGEVKKSCCGGTTGRRDPLPVEVTADRAPAHPGAGPEEQGV